jgi:hypothetical protein
LYREKGRIPGLQEQLETVGLSFVKGFNAAVISNSNEKLWRNLNKIEAGYRSFAFEGAGMYLGLIGLLFPWRRRRFFDFIKNEGVSYNIILTTGAGLALAKMKFFKRGAKAFINRLDPYLALVPYDSFGFYDGLYKTGRVSGKCSEPELPEITLPLYYQGIGRSLWILKSNKIEDIKETIARFPMSWQGDLWCGLWFAVSFAGGAKEEDLEKLWKLGEKQRSYAALGIVQTAHMRSTHGFIPAWTENVCRNLLNMEAEEAVRIFEISSSQARQNLKKEQEADLQNRLMNEIRRHILSYINKKRH